MPISWDDDPPGYDAQLVANLANVLRSIHAEAGQRNSPRVATAQEWHRRLYDQVPLPVPYFAGEVRDSDPQYPELIDYEVAVGGSQGAPAAQVPRELADFERRAQAAVQGLDQQIAPGSMPTSSAEVYSVLVLCARLHGEWVRIHPFANGNGRIGRLWANWAAERYGFPPFVTTKPRPGQPYGSAAFSSMQGNHGPMVAVFHQLLVQRLRRNP